MSGNLNATPDTLPCPDPKPRLVIFIVDKWLKAKRLLALVRVVL